MMRLYSMHLKAGSTGAEEVTLSYRGLTLNGNLETAGTEWQQGPVALSELKPGVERPLTVRVAEDLYASVTEARLACPHARSRRIRSTRRKG